MKTASYFLLCILLVAGCQEPSFRQQTKPETPTDQILIDPEGKENKSGRAGRFISNPFWNLYRGNSDGLWFNFSSNGINWSTSSQVNSGALLDQAPETIFFNDRLIVAYRGRLIGSGSETVYITFSDDGINWTQIPTPITSTSTPALVVKNGLLFVYSTLSAPPWNDGTVYQWSTSDLANWSSNLVTGIPGNLPGYGLSAALDLINRVHLFYHIPDGGNVRMKSASSNDGISFGGPTQVVRDYGISSGVDNDAVSRDGAIAMVYRASNGNVRVIPDIINAQSISYAIPNSSTSRGPSITFRGGRLIVTYKGNSTNNVWFSFSDNGGVSWSAQTTHPGSTPSGPSITAIGAN